VSVFGRFDGLLVGRKINDRKAALLKVETKFLIESMGDHSFLG
jgi:hypothetical protein